jgi:hypothetical protein
MNNDLVGPFECSNILVKNVSATAGIERIQFESFNPSDGGAYYSVPAWYDSSSGTAGVGTGSINSVTIGTHLPEMDGTLWGRFIIFDKAGNKTVAQTTVRYNGSNHPAPELVAIYNPNVSTEFIPGSGLVGYEQYTPGMTVYANPMKLLYRVVKTNWVDYNPDYGLGASNGTVIYTDDQ